MSSDNKFPLDAQIKTGFDLIDQGVNIVDTGLELDPKVSQLLAHEIALQVLKAIRNDVETLSVFVGFLESHSSVLMKLIADDKLIAKTVLEITKQGHLADLLFLVRKFSLNTELIMFVSKIIGKPERPKKAADKEASKKLSPEESAKLRRSFVNFIKSKEERLTKTELNAWLEKKMSELGITRRQIYSYLAHSSGKLSVKRPIEEQIPHGLQAHVSKLRNQK